VFGDLPEGIVEANGAVLEELGHLLDALGELLGSFLHPDHVADQTFKLFPERFQAHTPEIHVGLFHALDPEGLYPEIGQPGFSLFCFLGAFREQIEGVGETLEVGSSANDPTILTLREVDGLPRPHHRRRRGHRFGNVGHADLNVGGAGRQLLELLSDSADRPASLLGAVRLKLDCNGIATH